MKRDDITEIKVDEGGTETHESWLLIRASRISGGGRRLFDSEMSHEHFVRVTISRARRNRELNRDRKGEVKTILEMDMSMVQWGAFVSSFGMGTGVAATLSFFNGDDLPRGHVPQSPLDSRLHESHKEVSNAASEALTELEAAFADIKESFEAGAGKKIMREKLRALEIRMDNMPSNMEFAAKSLTEHVENVVTKARVDIEGMVLEAQASGLSLNERNTPQILMIEGGDPS